MLDLSFYLFFLFDSHSLKDNFYQIKICSRQEMIMQDLAVRLIMWFRRNLDVSKTCKESHCRIMFLSCALKCLMCQVRS